ncbi:MAG: hypothetical protein M1114_06695 [Candidatus Dependentiae bacterium]|nr:hypothetical protein [Candidatus Dependentiae bacterium]
MNKLTLVALFATITLTGSALANVKIYNQTPYNLKVIVHWDGGSQKFDTIEPQNNPDKNGKVTRDAWNQKRQLQVFANYQGAEVLAIDTKINSGGNIALYIGYTGDRNSLPRLKDFTFQKSHY